MMIIIFYRGGTDVRLIDYDDKTITLGKAFSGSEGASQVADIEIHVRISKNNQMRVGFKRKLYRSGDDELCVVQAGLLGPYAFYLQSSGLSSGVCL